MENYRLVLPAQKCGKIDTKRVSQDALACVVMKRLLNGRVCANLSAASSFDETQECSNSTLKIGH